MKTRTLLALSLSLVASQAMAVSAIRNASGALSVSETITDLGGSYLYSYTLSNDAAVDSVWWWGVYHTGGTLSNASSAPFGGLYAGSTPGDIILAGTSNVGFTYNFDGLSDSSQGILVGQTSTLSFESDVLDTSIKTFFADITNEWAPNNLGYGNDGMQIYSYMGTTEAVPEPATLAVLGVGLLAARRRCS